MTCLPDDQCQRIYAGEAPLKVWREFLGFSQTDLRRETGIRVEVLDKLERGLRDPTRAEALKLARALDIHAHNLTAHRLAYDCCVDLDVDEDAIIGAGERDA